MNGQVKIGILNNTAHEKLAELSYRLNIPILNSPTEVEHFDYLLTYQDNKLTLLDTRKNNRTPITIDFSAGKYAYRSRAGVGIKQHLIARAVGIKPGYRASIIDATAGFAQDAFVLASLGCQVTMLERSPIIAALIEDALSRAKSTEALNSITLSLVCLDAQEYLKKLPAEKYPDVIYLDPMYSHLNDSALNKLCMRQIRDIVGGDDDAEQLLPLALQIAQKRVVIKRPRLAPCLGSLSPTIVYEGRSSRFDVHNVLRVIE